MCDGEQERDRDGAESERWPLERKLYGRRRSHKLRVNRRDLMDELLPALAPLGVGAGGAAPSPPPGALDPLELFDDAEEVWLEIGFGGGEHLAHLAARHPKIGFIGCEHYVDGVAKLLGEIERADLGNVRVHPHDARDLMDALRDGSIGRAFLLYPDPWPKKRHHKRRFITQDTLDAFGRLMTAGAELRIASDIPDYIRHCLAALSRRRDSGRLDFAWTAERAADWLDPWADWPGTRYERKALEAGRAPCYLSFVRTDAPSPAHASPRNRDEAEA